VLVSQEAYRIVQEGLTNALKYSADGTAALSMSLHTGTLEIQLTNPARGSHATRAGRGLRGIDERAATLGGTTSASDDGGRWALSVALPAGTLQG
jgi:signal transduction histidine kinase